MAEQDVKQDLPDLAVQLEDAGGKGEKSEAGGSLTAGDLSLVLEVPLRLSVELGSANLPVRDVLALTKGSIVELDRMNGEPADVYANDRLIARGELAVSDQRVAIRITELIGPKNRG